MKRFGFATMIAATVVTSLHGAPRAQYDYYLTGNGTNAEGRTQFGLGLMGGGTDVDALFTWMSDRAGGGDFVVIRASGADGYNQYVYDLGHFDSVETLVLKNRAASSDTFVLQTIRNAEALFIAGGDQSDYVNNWKGTPVEDAIHELADRGIPIAGTVRAPPSSASSPTPHCESRSTRARRSPIRTARTSHWSPSSWCCRS
jgi:cyanophycinase-like exopeptidase